MADLFVVEELQRHLVSEAIAQLPGATPSPTIPSVWLQPRDGAPLPRAGEKATITLVDQMLNSPAGLESFLEEAFINVTVRSEGAALGKLIHRMLHTLIVPLGISGGRMHWEMNDLTVQYSDRIRADQVLDVTDKGVYTRVATFRFGARRVDLAGI